MNGIKSMSSFDLKKSFAVTIVLLGTSACTTISQEQPIPTAPPVSYAQEKIALNNSQAAELQAKKDLTQAETYHIRVQVAARILATAARAEIANNGAQGYENVNELLNIISSNDAAYRQAAKSAMGSEGITRAQLEQHAHAVTKKSDGIYSWTLPTPEK